MLVEILEQSGLCDHHRIPPGTNEAYKYEYALVQKAYGCWTGQNG